MNISNTSLKYIFFDLGDTLVNSDGEWIDGAKEILNALHDENIHLGLISNLF